MKHCLWCHLRAVLLSSVLCGLAWVQAAAQDTVPAAPPAPSSAQPPQPLPDAPKPRGDLRQRTPEEEAARAAAPFIVNGRPYLQPTLRNQFHDYLRDSYGPPAFARTTVRALYNQWQDGPSGWGQDFPGFMQRFGSNAAITAIGGNVRFGMGRLFHEDLRYIPCHGCSVKRSSKTPCSPR